jgi:putative ABC transport system substrate-binding protein
VDRRRFLLTSLAGALAASRGAGAQPTGKVPRIAFLTTTSPGGSPTTDAFLHGLRELGYVEGQNLAVEWRWGRGSTERFSDFAAEVVRLKWTSLSLRTMSLAAPPSERPRRFPS